jgi:ribonuclease BN (tRNA processing enzyme)
VQLTVLGSAASWAGSGRACSGYLVEDEGTTLLVDCGNGSLANAAQVTDVTSLDGVLISHMHPDHFADIYCLQAALRFSPEGPVGSLPLHLPEGLWERLGALLFERGRKQLAEAFEPHPIVAGRALHFEGITVTPHAVDHDGPTFAFTFEAGGSTLAYTSDTRDGEAVRGAVAGCDVLLAECTLPEGYEGMGAHMTAAEAGRLAEGSGAGMLVLTHLWPTADHARMLRTASSVFSGQVHLAEELLTIEIAPARGAGKGAGR